jgi:hypothetical protein
LGTSYADAVIFMKHIDDWDFTPDVDGKWHWQCHRPNGTHAESRQSFASRTDCIVDAMRHGYLAREPGCQPETTATELH